MAASCLHLTNSLSRFETLLQQASFPPLQLKEQHDLLMCQRFSRTYPFSKRSACSTFQFCSKTPAIFPDTCSKQHIPSVIFACSRRNKDTRNSASSALRTVSRKGPKALEPGCEVRNEITTNFAA